MLAAASRSVRPLGARLVRCAFQSTKAGATAGDAALTKLFMEHDAAAAASAAPAVALPLKLTGRSGELVTGLFASKGKDAAAYGKAVAELDGLVAAVAAAGLVVERFFSSANYSAGECKLVVDLLISSKEPLTSFDSIKNADVREILVDNASNLDAWRGARKAVAALNLSDDVKRILETIAAEARLDLLKHVASKASELLAVTSKALEAVVTSAVPLTKEQQSAVAKALPAYAPAGANLSVAYAVDPAVLGGLLVTLKNQTIDLTAATRLVEVAAGGRAMA